MTTPRQDVRDAVADAINKMGTLHFTFDERAAADQLIALLDAAGYAVVCKADLRRAVDAIVNDAVDMVPGLWPTRRG